MRENNKIKLGAFLLISIVLLVTSFTAAGIGKLLKTKLKAMTLLNTSVEGMMVGSPVKYLGMTIGKVTGLAMRKNNTQIAVYFDLFPELIEDPDGDFSAKDLQTLVDQDALHCFINAAGLMGGSYLELEWSSTQRSALKTEYHVHTQAGVTYIPSRPSHIGNAIQNVSRLLEDIKDINLRRFADKTDKLLDSLDRVMNRGELDRTIAMLNRACGNMEHLSDRLVVTLSDENLEKFHKLINNLAVTCDRLEDFSKKAELAELSSNLNLFVKESLRFLKDVENGSGNTGAGLTSLRMRMEQTLIRIDNVLQEVSGAAAALQDDPSQFVRGKNPKAW